ncbi:MAG: sulfatase [Bacteroidales bacterium]|nr:sulfatase [Bacteroidales bacterium]
MNWKFWHPALIGMNSSLILPVVPGMATPPKPNIVFILADDLGYTDLSCYGATRIKTPNLDEMAKEGVRFTGFYAPAGVCTPTRASLMTGCYPKRVSLHVGVLRPDTHNGLNTKELTIAELLKTQGYTTGCIGKWHLGLLPDVLPTAQGFDYYYGMPGPNHGRSDLYRNATLISKNSDVPYDQITKNYTSEAIAFITNNNPSVTGKPFFLYLAHSMPHIPLAVSDDFKGKSEQGLYGDVIMELDWGIGEVLHILEEEGLMNNTLIVFTSDNGPSDIAAPPLHGGKGSTWEAGFRVPLIVKWPGVIPAGSLCHEMATMMDFMPTLARLAGATVPTDREIDGHDIWPLITGKKSKSPYKAFYYFGRDGKLAAMREGKWKVHLLAPSEMWAGKQPVKEALLDTKPAVEPPWLYDLSSDIGETKNVAAENKKITDKLIKKAQAFDRELEARIRPAYAE